jgi:hypothetical protein
LAHAHIRTLIYTYPQTRIQTYANRYGRKKKHIPIKTPLKCYIIRYSRSKLALEREIGKKNGRDEKWTHSMMRQIDFNVASSIIRMHRSLHQGFEEE